MYLDVLMDFDDTLKGIFQQDIELKDFIDTDGRLLLE